MSNFDGKKWTEKELEILYTERLKGTPYKVLSDKLNRTVKALESKFNKDTDWSQYSFYNNPSLETRELEIKEAHINRDMSIKKSLDKYRLQADIIADKLYQAARKLPVAEPPSYTPSNKNHRTDEDMALMLSDLHIGHEHNLEETGGLSEYNVDVFCQRLENLKQAVTDIKELHSKLYKIRKLHIFSLGDIVDGANTAGAWSQVWIDTPIFDQVMLGYRKIADFVYYMLTLFEEVEFYGLYGNHGRIAPNGAEKKYNNFDLFCYKYLEIEFKNEPRIKFNIEKSWWMMKEIQNHKFLLVHGDDVKSKNPPVTSFLDFERKMTGIIRQIPNYTLCGHFHNCSEYTTHNGRVLMNGSFVGADVYSLTNQMPGNSPEQKIFGIHPKIGITWTYNINLKHNRS
jgi:hypothetical protein